MRPLFALLLSLAILGAVGGYLRLEHALRTELAQQTTETESKAITGETFSLEVTLTFDAGGDSPFALEPTQSTAVLVRFRDRALLRIEEPVAAGAPVRVESIEGVVPGANEFYIEATPAPDAPPIARAVRVRLFRNGNPIADQTLWSEPGLPVRGAVRVEVDQKASRQDHKH